MSAVLYGLCLLQAFTYLQSKLSSFIPKNHLNIVTEFTRDPWFTKAAVSLRLLITTPA
jgi:flagellar biosynthesis protein FliQ